MDQSGVVPRCSNEIIELDLWVTHRAPLVAPIASRAVNGRDDGTARLIQEDHSF
jgi:hypothetical protein